MTRCELIMVYRSGLRAAVGARVEFLAIDRRVGAYCSEILSVAEPLPT